MKRAVFFLIFLLLFAGFFSCLFPLTAKAQSAPSTCQTKSEGDADCNGTVDMVDYFYFVQAYNRIQVPVGVSADFNQDGRTDITDRNTVVVRLGGKAGTVSSLFRSILASIANFHI